MKDRIMQIMEKEGMTQQEFATALEISPSSLSSIFNGRTNPTNNHVQAVHRRFPKISINWLMFGEGEMYGEGRPSEKSASPAAADSSVLPFEGDSPYRKPESGAGAAGAGAEGARASSVDAADVFGGKLPPSTAIPIIRETVKYIDKPQRKITEIRIFFDDGTFETFQGTR